MKLRLHFICVLLSLNTLRAQTFNAPGGAIPDSGGVQPCFPITVTGVGNINSNFGLASICVNINHNWVSDLEIYLQAPDGTTVPVSIQNGGSGNNYFGTCFSPLATAPIADAVAPFSGTYTPDGYMGAVNNGQNADGIWNLCIKDVAQGESGSLTGWSISFSNDLPPAPPACNGNLPPGNTCASATPVCSFNGFCSTTLSSYTADSWPQLDSVFCGTVQNNAFVKFIATGDYMNFSIWVTSSTDHNGIQMFFYDGGCASGLVTDYGCYSPIRPGASPTVISATGLTPGNTYYLMIDGYAGDVCNYIMQPFPNTNALTVSATPPDICLGKAVQLNAAGGNGNYSWSGPGLSSDTGRTVTATTLSNTVYSVSSVDPGGICPVTKQVSVSVIALPDPPTVTDTLSYCERAAAVPLVANGTNLLWYASASGGGGTQTISPSTENPGNEVYYVTQTPGNCESPRTPIHILIKNKPDIGADRQDTICTGKAANLTRKFNLTGLNNNWTFNSNTIDAPYSVNIPGLYEVKAANSAGCTDTAFIRLFVQPPFHAFAGNDTIAVKGMPQQLSCSPANTYSWSPAGPLNFSNIQNPLAILDSDQQFIVQVSDALGCTGSDTVMIKVYPGPTYYIPNAFTPNGDGLNDIFRPVPVGIVRTEYCRIINRYGKIIFESTDLSKGWDGTYSGSMQSPGSYVWLIKGIDKNGKTIEMKGTVVLIL